jgi:putative endonuclease
VSGAPFELRWGGPLNRRRIGEKGDSLALRYLAKKGYATVARNYRTRHGEIDLTMRD